jgi:hypothetical protein
MNRLSQRVVGLKTAFAERDKNQTTNLDLQGISTNCTGLNSFMSLHKAVKTVALHTTKRGCEIFPHINIPLNKYIWIAESYNVQRGSLRESIIHAQNLLKGTIAPEQIIGLMWVKLDGQGGVLYMSPQTVKEFKFDLHKSSPSGVAKNLHAIHRLQKQINSKDNGLCHSCEVINCLFESAKGKGIAGGDFI